MLSVQAEREVNFFRKKSLNILLFPKYPFLTIKVDRLISAKDVFILESLAAQIFKAYKPLVPCHMQHVA